MYTQIWQRFSIWQNKKNPEKNAQKIFMSTSGQKLVYISAMWLGAQQSCVPQSGGIDLVLNYSDATYCYKLPFVHLLFL